MVFARASPTVIVTRVVAYNDATLSRFRPQIAKYRLCYDALVALSPPRSIMSVRSKEVCQRIGEPATTLRLWSNTFQEFLSPSAQASMSIRGTPVQRRYTDGDMELLGRVKSLLAIGMTYGQIQDALANNPTSQPALAPVRSPNGHSEANAVATVDNSRQELVALMQSIDDHMARLVELEESWPTLVQEAMEEALEKALKIALMETVAEPLTKFTEQMSIEMQRNPEPFLDRLFALLRKGLGIKADD